MTNTKDYTPILSTLLVPDSPNVRGEECFLALAADAITQVGRIADQMVRQNDLHEESLTLSREKLAVDKQVASGTEALERELLAQTANRATAKKPGRRDA